MLHGFMTAVREAGAAYEIPETLDLDSPADMIRDYMRRRSAEPDAPDGFTCPGEVSALATITGMSDNGLSLGVEYDIVAKQTSRLLSQIQPKVETIYEDLKAAGEGMGSLLLQRIAGEPVADLTILQSPQFSFPTP
jgi:LacI family transcriptional regulator